MRDIIRHITVLCAVVLALMSGGCVYDDSPAGCGDTERLQGSVPVRFTLKLDGYGSRADGGGVWNDNHEKVIGTRFDSEVDRLHVMLIGNDGSLAHVDLRQYMYDADAKGYTFIGNIDLGEEGWEPGSYRVMLLANCGPALMSATTLDGLKSTIADVMWYSPNGSPRNGVRIPMWGMTTHDFTFTGKKDSPEEIGSIDLLRALAKVEIKLDPTKMEGYRLVSARMSAANSYIDPFPAGWETATATLDGTLRYGHSFNPVKTPVGGHDFAPGIYTGEEEGSIVFYLPEYDSSEAAGGEATIDVTVRHEASGQTLTYPAAIHFNDANVNGGGTTGDATRLATDIVRNHYYLFTIDGIHFGTLTYDVDCWDYIPSTLGWDINQNEEHYLRYKNIDSRYCFITHPRIVSKDINQLVDGALKKVEIKVLENSSSQLNFTFTITKPEGAVWKVFLYDDKECTIEHDYKYFRFAPGNDNKNNQQAVRTGIARPEPYNIAIDVNKNCWVKDSYVGKLEYPSAFDKNTGEITGYEARKEDLFVAKSEGSDRYDIPMPIILDGSDDDVLSPLATSYRDAGEVPTVYLAIKVSLDGEQFTENLVINPPYTAADGEKYFGDLTYPGTKTAIQIRQVLVGDYKAGPKELMEGVIGDNRFGWWDTPMGYTQP
ncbi:MAG: hypothetical protein K2G49_10590 [Muribaculum sp.]|nr:hypothetical protein [Muribaculum sp.]